MRFLSVSILLFHLAHTLFGQTFYPVAAIPPELLTNANSVVREHEIAFRITTPDEAIMEEWIVVTILNKQGAAHARWVEADDEFTKISSIKGSLYDEEGFLVRESDKKDVRDYGSFSEKEFINANLKTLEMDYGKLPFTVAFRIRKTLKGFFRIPDFLVQELGQSVEKSSFQFMAPADYGFNWKAINTLEKPIVKAINKEKATIWKFANLPAVESEPYHPYLDAQYAKILIAPTQVNIDGYSGDFSNWSKIGAFFYELNKDRDALSIKMEATVRELTKDKKTTREKIDAIYRYLQQNHRYVSIQIGIGGWQTLAASFVEEKKYGDCKALSNYMFSMLKVAGIESYVADIYAGSNGSPEWYEDAPIPNANHVILYVPGEDLWLECTSNSVPSGYLSNFTAGRQALLLTPQGGKIIKTPALTAADNTQNSNIMLKLDEKGGAEVQNHILVTCDLHDSYRYWSKDKKQADLEKEFIENAEFQIAQLQHLHMSASDSKPEAQLEYSLKINSLATKSGKRMFVPINKIHPFKRSLPANEKRVLDLKMLDTYTWKDTLEIQIPAGYSVENFPSAKHVQSEFGRLDLEASVQENSIRILRYIEMQPVEVPAARYNEVRQFFQDVTKADAAQLVLLKQ